MDMDEVTGELFSALRIEILHSRRSWRRDRWVFRFDADRLELVVAEYYEESMNERGEFETTKSYASNDPKLSSLLRPPPAPFVVTSKARALLMDKVTYRPS